MEKKTVSKKSKQYEIGLSVGILFLVVLAAIIVVRSRFYIDEKKEQERLDSIAQEKEKEQAEKEKEQIEKINSYDTHEIKNYIDSYIASLSSDYEVSEPVYTVETKDGVDLYINVEFKIDEYIYVRYSFNLDQSIYSLSVASWASEKETRDIMITTIDRLELSQDESTALKQAIIRNEDYEYNWFKSMNGGYYKHNAPSIVYRDKIDSLSIYFHYDDSNDIEN